MKYAEIDPQYDLNRLVEMWGFEKHYIKGHIKRYDTFEIQISNIFREVRLYSFDNILLAPIPQIIVDLTLDGAFKRKENKND